MRRVHDLGMELHAVELARGVLERGDRRVLRRRDDPRARRRLDDGVAVRHPRGLLRRAASRRARRSLVRMLDLAVLAGAGPVDAAAQVEREQLRAVTDAERRDAELEDRRCRSSARRRRTPTQGRPRGSARPGSAPRISSTRRAMRDELRVDARLAHAARDQLRVLAAEIDDEHRTLLGDGSGRSCDDLSRAGNSVRPS